MINKDVIFNWGNTKKESFNWILKSISKSLGLLIPYFTKDFIIYTFAYDVAYVAVLTQRNQQNYEVPIYFMSSNFKGGELNYHGVEK